MIKRIVEKYLVPEHDVLDPSAIIRGGEMAKKRIGDLLPFGYGL